MKKIIFLVFFGFCIQLHIFAQEENNTSLPTQQKAYPNEGIKAFMESFVEKFNYKNADKIPNDVTEIKLRVKFIVEKDGTFNDINLVDDTYNFKKEVERVFNEMPLWNAAIHEGKNVRSSFTLPLTIRIDQSKSLSDEIVYKTTEGVNAFKSTLNQNKIETDYFDLTCNCGIVKSAKNDELKTEEFMLQSQDDQAIYNIAFRKMDAEKAKEELRTIEKDAVDKNAIMEKNMFNGVTATEISLSIPNGDYINNYRTIFLYKNEYIVGISIVSYKKQIADLLFEHLKSNFKLKI